MRNPWIPFLLGAWLALHAFSAASASAQAVPGGAAAEKDGAIQRRAEGYDVPNVARANFLGWVRRDVTDRIPSEETLFKQYEDEWGFQFETVSINGIVFALNMDIDGKYPFDITLMDTDCDGVFETKVEEKPGQRIDLSIPECVFRPTTAEKR